MRFSLDRRRAVVVFILIFFLSFFFFVVKHIFRIVFNVLWAPLRGRVAFFIYLKYYIEATFSKEIEIYLFISPQRRVVVFLGRLYTYRYLSWAWRKRRSSKLHRQNILLYISGTIAYIIFLDTYTWFSSFSVVVFFLLNSKWLELIDGLFYFIIFFRVIFLFLFFDIYAHAFLLGSCQPKQPKYFPKKTNFTLGNDFSLSV